MSFLIQQFNCQPQFQYGNPLDSIPLWVAAREDNTLSSRLTRPSQFPSVSFYYFTYIGIWPGSYQDCQIKKTPFQVSHFIWQLPILPGSPQTRLSFLWKSRGFLSFMDLQPGTTRLCCTAKYFGVCELNFRVGMGATTTSCRCWLPFNWIEIRMDFL